MTIIGASLGGYLAPRAAAFDKRITKVIGWSIFPDFFDILLADDPKWLRNFMDRAFRRGFAGILNGLYKKMMRNNENQLLCYLAVSLFIADTVTRSFNQIVD